MLYLKHFHHFTLPSDSLYQHGNEAANYPSWLPPTWTETVIQNLRWGHCGCNIVVSKASIST